MKEKKKNTKEELCNKKLPKFSDTMIPEKAGENNVFLNISLNVIVGVALNL